jgi:hypothetical protein
MSYILILTIIHSFGAVDVQRQTGFATYGECVEHAVAWADSQRPLYPRIRICAGNASMVTNDADGRLCRRGSAMMRRAIHNSVILLSRSMVAA